MLAHLSSVQIDYVVVLNTSSDIVKVLIQREMKKYGCDIKSFKLTKGRNKKSRKVLPLFPETVMRVDRHDIWGNLTQIEWGVSYILSRVVRETYRAPSLLFSLFDDPDLEERERSRYNNSSWKAFEI